jgi:hypothetical protein
MWLAGPRLEIGVGNIDDPDIERKMAIAIVGAVRKAAVTE